MAAGRVTLSDIAKEANVSVTIVSKVINGTWKGKVSDPKRKLILELVRKYGYMPLSSARSLVTRRNYQIAFLLSDKTSMLFENPVYVQMLQGTMQESSARGYNCQVQFCDCSNMEHFSIPENLLRHGVDGCILSGAIDYDVLQKITTVQLPFVMLGGESVRDRIPVITRTSLPEYEEFLRYCYERGHRRIMICGYSKNGLEKYTLLAKRFPSLHLELYNGHTEDKCREAAEFILQFPAEKRPTMLAGDGIFCNGVLNLLREQGILCPRDISCIATSNDLFTRLHTPQLTTMSADFVAHGVLGTRLLIDMIEQDLPEEEAIRRAWNAGIKSIIEEHDSVRILV